MEINLLTFLLDNLPGGLSNNNIFNSRIRPLIMAKRQYLLVEISRPLYNRLQKEYQFPELIGVEITDEQDEEILFKATSQPLSIIGYCNSRSYQSIFFISSTNTNSNISKIEKIVQNENGFWHEIDIIENFKSKTNIEKKTTIYNIYDKYSKLIETRTSSPIDDLIKDAKDTMEKHHSLTSPKTIGENYQKKVAYKFPMTDAFILADLEYYINPIYDTLDITHDKKIDEHFFKILDNSLWNLVNSYKANIILSFKAMALIISALSKNPTYGYAEMIIEENGNFTKVGLYIKNDQILTLPKSITAEEATSLYFSDEANATRPSLNEIFNPLSLN